MPQCRLDILDVGHGNSTVLRQPNKVMVIDAGPGSSLLEFFEAEDITAIDTLIISHADSDHIGGVLNLLASPTLMPRRVFLNSDSSKGSRIWDDLLAALTDAHKRGDIEFNVGLTVANSGTFDSETVKVQILAPDQYLAGKGAGGRDNHGRLLSTNSLSVVIRLVKDGKPVALLPGDLDEIGLARILENGVDIGAPIAVYPHHGGRAGSGNVAQFAEQFLKAVAPEMMIFSIGRGQFETPSPDVVKALRQANPNLRVACTQLSEHCASNTPNGVPTHLTNSFARGRERNACCAGTLRVDLDQGNEVFPAHADHTSFIQLAAPGALCRKPT
jgi:beta-lactamase superfamily II metal-dependent hydrolase